MTTLYICESDTLKTVAVIIGMDEDDCQSQAYELNYDLEQYEWTYCSNKIW